MAALFRLLEQQNQIIYASIAGIGIIDVIILFFTFSLCARRFHDFGKSGWMTLLCRIPFFNVLVLIRLLFIKGNDDGNKYGGVSSGDSKFFRIIFIGY